MCGRFVSASPPDEIARYFEAAAPIEHTFEPSYNVAPTDGVFGVLDTESSRTLVNLRWGLVPPWAKGPSVGSRLINARAETLSQKAAFSSAFRRRRCIIPADGFYEWQRIPGGRTKQPMFIHGADGAPLAFAGLWEMWRDPTNVNAKALRSFTIITTTANAKMSPIHDRMPVILERGAWDQWLDTDQVDLSVLSEMLVPAPERLLDTRPVGTAVNHVANNGAQLIARVEPTRDSAGQQGTLL